MARTSATRGKPASAWPFVLTAFAASRLLFLGTGALARIFLPEAEPAGFPLEPPGFMGYWAHWDGAWYAQIATEGYGAGAPASTAFFPLYPMLVRLGTVLGGGPALWGVLISSVATLFTLYFLYGLAERLYDTGAARTSTLALAFFPTAFFPQRRLHGGVVPDVHDRQRVGAVHETRFIPRGVARGAGRSDPQPGGCCS